MHCYLFFIRILWLNTIIEKSGHEQNKPICWGFRIREGSSEWINCVHRNKTLIANECKNKQTNQ